MIGKTFAFDKHYTREVKMTTLLLVRHGESGANGKGCFAGHLDIDLSELGYRQAEATADYIAEKYNVNAIYSSDLMRASHTAEVIAGKIGLSMQKTEKLREIYAGEWQGLTFDELQKEYAVSYGVWLSDMGKAACPNGETVAELYERVWNALQEIAEENIGKTIVVATHATPIRAICCRLNGKDVRQMKEEAWVSNASVTEIVYDKGLWTLKRKGADEFLTGMQTKFPPNV